MESVTRSIETMQVKFFKKLNEVIKSKESGDVKIKIIRSLVDDYGCFQSRAVSKLIEKCFS